MSDQVEKVLVHYENKIKSKDEQIKILEEALEFYACQDNYYQIEDREKSDIFLDLGNFARQVLMKLQGIRNGNMG